MLFIPHFKGRLKPVYDGLNFVAQLCVSLRSVTYVLYTEKRSDFKMLTLKKVILKIQCCQYFGKFDKLNNKPAFENLTIQSIHLTLCPKLTYFLVSRISFWLVDMDSPPLHFQFPLLGNPDVITEFRQD